MSFWQENAIAVIKLDFQKVLRRISYGAPSRDFVARGQLLHGQKRLAPLAKRSTCSKSIVKCKKFYHFAIRRGLNLLNNHTNFFGRNLSKLKLSGVFFFFFENVRKNFKLNLVLLLIPVLKSKVL